MSTIDRESEARAARFAIPTLQQIFRGPLANRVRRMAQWRKQGAAPDGARPGARRAMRFETLEPRVLLSANDLIGDLSGSMVAGMTAVSSEIQSAIDTEDSTFDSLVPGVLVTERNGDEVDLVSSTVRELMAIDVDLDPDHPYPFNSNLAHGESGLSESATLQQRYDAIASGSVFSAFEGNLQKREKILDAIDLDGDDKVAWKEAFDVLVVGQIQSWLDGYDASGETVDSFKVDFVNFLNFGIFGFHLPQSSLTSPLFDLSVSGASDQSGEGELKFAFDVDLRLEQLQPVYLGLEGDRHEILPIVQENDLLNGSTSDDSVDTPQVNVKRGISVESFTVGFNGIEDMDPAVTQDDFFFATPEGMRVGVDVNSTQSFDIRVGFLGGHVSNGTVVLDMGAQTTAVDPSNPDAIGFSLSQQGVADGDGSVTADEAPSLSLANDIVFSLKIGSHDVNAVEVTVPAGDYANLDALKTAVQNAINATGYNGLVTVSDDGGGKLVLSLPSSDAAPLGFANEAFATTTLLAGLPTLVGNTGSSHVQFLLAVDGAAPRLVSFDTSLVDHDGDAMTPDQVTLDSLIGDLNGALAAAALAVTASKRPAPDDDKIRLTANTVGQTLEITHTLTLDTVEEITIEELGSGNVFGTALPEPGASLVVDWDVAVTAGIGWNPPAQTLRVDIDPWSPSDVTEGSVEGQRRASFAILGEDTNNPGSFVAIDDDASAFLPLLDFNVVGPSEVAGLFGQLATFAQQLSDSDLMNKFGIPFVQGDFGDVLDFDDMLRDTLLIDDHDDDNPDNDTPKLLGMINDQLTVRFDTAQELAHALDVVLPSWSSADIDATYDPDTRELTYNISLEHDMLDVSKPIDFNLDLGQLGGVVAGSAVKIEPTGRFDATVGLKMGNVFGPLEPDTKLVDLNGGKGVPIMDHLAITTAGAIEGIVGRLSGDAHFTVIVDNSGTLSAQDVTVYRVVPGGVTSVQTGTDDNYEIGQLVADVNLALQDAGLASDLVADSEGGRIILRALAGVDRFWISSNTTDRAATELGLVPQVAGTVSLIGSKAVSQVAPSDDIDLEIVVDRGGSADAPVTVHLLQNATAGNAANTTGNATVADLVYDINRAIDASALAGQIVAVRSGSSIVLAAAAHDIDAFSVEVTAGPGAEIGFDIAAEHTRLKALGLEAATADAIGVFVAGPAAVADGEPGSAFGRLSDDAHFSISLDGDTAIPVTVAADGSKGNRSISDLVVAVNKAMNGTDLEGKVIVSTDGTHLAFQAIASDIENFDVVAGAHADQLGLAGTLSATSPLRAVASKAAPLSYGVNQNATFSVHVVDSVLGASDTPVTLYAKDTITNGSVYQLAASLNKALDVGFGGTGKSPIMASVQAGQIVFSLRTAAGPGTPTGALASVAQNVTAFSISASHLDSAVTQLNIKNVGETPAGTVMVDANDYDLLVFTNDGSHFGVVLDPLLVDGGDADSDPDGTIQDVIDAIHNAAGNGGKAEAAIGGDGASLILVQDNSISLASGEFRVELVNGSPAALALGIFGTDTVTTDVAQSNPKDGVIEGSRIATVRAVDRFFLRKAGDMLTADLTLSIDALDADATLGFVGIGLTSGAQQLYKATGGLGISDPSNEVTLGQLLDATGSKGSILKLRELLDRPHFSPDTSGSADDDDFVLDVSLEPATDLITLGATPQLRLNLASLGGLNDTASGVAARLPQVTVDELDLGDLANFGAIGFDDVITALQSVADFLQEFGAFPFLGDEIPLIGLSVNDVLDIAGRFQQAVSDIRGAASGAHAMLGTPTVTFADAVGGDTITRSAGSWVTDGFKPGQLLSVSGSQTANEGTYRIVKVSDKVVTLSLDDSLSDETVSGWSAPAELHITAGSNGANNAQVLAQRISEAFNIPVFDPSDPQYTDKLNQYFANYGIPNPTDLIQFALANLNATNDLLRFDLRLPVGFSEAYPIALDLGSVDFLGETLPVQLNGSAGLGVSGYIDAKLSFGIDLNDPTQIYLFDDATGVTGHLGASANNLTFNVAIGPLGAFVKDGNASIALDFTFDNSAADAAPEPINQAGLFDSFTPALTGSVGAVLPVYFPTESSFLGDITLDISGLQLVFDSPPHLGQGGSPLDLTDLASFITLPDFSQIDLSAIDPFSSVGSLLDALDTFLGGMQDVLDGQVFGFKLPFIGDQLSAGADFIEDLRRDVLAPIRQYVDQAPELADDLMQQLLFSLLGPGSDVLDDSGITLANGQSLEDFLGVGTIDGLGLLRKLSDGSVIPATIGDVGDYVRSSDPGGDGFQWQVRLGQTFSPSVDIAFDLGFPALGLAMDTSLDVDFTWDLAFGLGLSKQDGAFILVGSDTIASGEGNRRQVNGQDVDDELFLSVDVTLPEGSTLIDGRLGFLQLEVTPVDDDFDSGLAGGDPGADPTHFHADFSVDLRNSADTGDARMSFSELGNLEAVVDANADAQVNLAVVAKFNEDLIGEDASSFLPSISTTFVLDWRLDGILSGDLSLGDSLDYVAFDHVTIDLGSFLGNTIGPVVDQIQDITGPLQPIIDVITAPIPVISQLAGKPVTLVDIAGLTGYVEPAMIYAIADLITLVNSLPASPTSLMVDIGSFVLVGEGSSEGLGSALADPNFSLGADSSLFDLGDSLPAGFQDTLDGIQSLVAGAGSSGTKDAVNGLLDGAESGSSGFAFPIFEKPSSIFGLLLGRDVALITYDLAPFGMNFSYTQKFPIWGPLWASITGAASLTIDLAFGYDTAGIRKFVEGGAQNPLDLIGGFYVSDTDLPEGTGGVDVPELVLSGELFAGAEVNLGVASAGVEGGVILTVNFDLYDPDHDGRVRLAELLGNVLYEFQYGDPLLAPVAIFDVFGDVAAQLRAYIEFLFIKKTFEITPPITLFEFSLDFERQAHLATERGDGSLLINVGPYAQSRENGDTRDVGETIHVKSTSSDKVLVWSEQFNVASGGAQEYDLGENKEIVIIGGEGDDTIDVSGVTHSGISLRIEGGAGNDTIVLGPDTVSAEIKGGDGDDHITGGGHDDIIYGGLGNDTIDGGGGNDIIFGDTGVYRPEKPGEDGEPPVLGRIRALVGSKDGNDSITGGDGNDIIFGGGGFDLIEGGADDDLMFGDGGFFDFAEGNALPMANGRVDASKMNARGAGARDHIFGNGGDDTAFGGAGDDLMDGGAGSDQMFGGDGFDSIYGGSGADFLYGEAQDDVIFGFRDPTAPASDKDAADNDDTLDGVDYIEGGDGNDFIRGNGAGDEIYGGRGADIIFGDAGDDDIYGEAGPDIIFGGADGDFIDSGDGNDIVFGDDGLVVYQGFYDPAKVAGLIADRKVVDDSVIGSLVRADDMNGDRLIGDGPKTLIAGYVGDSIATSQDLMVTEPLASDGSDTVIGGDGKDVVFGGGGLLDTLYGDFDPSAPPPGPRPSGQDVLIGDGGRLELVARRYKAAMAISNALDGVDHISGNDSGDFIFGGGASDVLYGFEDAASFSNVPLEDVSENDVMLGDNGQIDFDTGNPSNKIRKIFTTYVPGDSGASDVAFGNFGNDVILGGLNSSSDVLNGDTGDDVILGDQGELVFDLDGTSEEQLDTLDRIRSYPNEPGGDDIISGSAGYDVLIGGVGGDIMYGDDENASHHDDDGEDIMLGDNADILLIGPEGRLQVRVAAMPAATAVDIIKTTDVLETTGGADTMSGNAKADIMLGGVNNDDGMGDAEVDTMYGDRAAPTTATIADDGDDIMLGDNGELDFTFGSDTDRNTLDLIHSYEDGHGGMDVVSGNKGQDVAIGGTGDDEIYGDDENASAGADDLGDLLLGDNADVFLVAPLNLGTGADLKLVLDAAVKTIRTTDEEHPEYGGSDTISGNADGDIIAGGVEGDTLYGDALSVVPLLDGDDIILGDNGAFEWLSTGRLDEIGDIDIDANNHELYLKYHPGVADDDLTTLDLVTTEQPTSGGRDTIYGDEGNDFAFGGTDLDWIHGDDGNGLAETASDNRDVLFGDHGRIYPQFSALNDFNSRNFFAIDTADNEGGEGDIMYGEEGDDVMLGQQGDDRMWGGSGDDDMIGGHNVSGGMDELTLPAVHATLNPPMNDLMDGGSGDDAMAGDNAIVWRRGDDVSPRFRTLTGDAIYTTSADGVDIATITTNVGGSAQSDPDDTVGRDIELLDHADATGAGLYGADVMAGGADSDVMFGQLGDDLMQGDGNIGADDMDPDFLTRHLVVTDSGIPDTGEDLYFNVPELGSDADDYMEGNGGNDLMYGGLGQDDMIGGSSNLFGLDTEDERPDGSDIIFGGAGAPARLVRNDFVGSTDTDIGTALGVGAVPVDDDPSITDYRDRHSRDADFIMGDNANIFRLVGAGDAFLEFNYDQFSAAEDRGSERIVVRAMQQLDYTLGGADYAGGAYVGGAAQPEGQPADNGAGDLIHGESGDDYIFGMTGSDVIFGESDDDDIVGGYGNDWISGGTGQDGVIGDDGLVYTSRNSTAGEPLYGVAGLLASDANAKYNNGDALNETIATPGDTQIALINVAGELKKTADLVPFSFDKSWIGMDDEFPDDASNTPYADDIIFGGLGSDFLHGGSGDDAISGAEALEHAYVPTFDAEGNADGVLDLGYDAFDLALPVNPGDTVSDPNPGNVLAFNPVDLDGQHLNNRFRAGEFFLYDEYDPRTKIMLGGDGELLWKSADQGTAYEYLLNFDQSEGVWRAGGDVPKATGQQTPTYDPVNDDGKDAIFGDLGNDWLVGGTGRDNMYGGWGNDLLNADDDLTTNGDANDQPDTHPYYEDRAYGGAGRDVLIGNTGGDRLIDWVGEYNSFLVPYAPFGQASVSRTLMPHLQEFLYALSAGDGADFTRYADAIGGTPPAPTNNDPIPSRNGEPFGELGLVLQKDFAWQDQTGAPADPQAGNIPGGKRDVLRTAGFNDGTLTGFAVDSGSFSVVNGKLSVAAESLGLEATAVLPLDDQLPSYYELLATVTVEKPTAGWKANAYIVFDYFDDQDFKFAGVNVSTNEVEIGYHDAAGWHVLKDVPKQLKSGNAYNLLIAINGTNVTLVVDNKKVLDYTFAPRVIDGWEYGLNMGLVGLGSDNSRGTFDNFTVQRVPPAYTLQLTEDLTADNGVLSADPAVGPAFSAIDLGMGRGLETDAILELSAVLSTDGAGGFAFDRYAADDYKFVTIDAAAGAIVVGHVTPKGGLAIDASFARTIEAGTDYTLTLRLKGTTASLSLGSQVVGGFVFNGVAVDGAFGLLGARGTTAFDTLTVKTSDSYFDVPESAMRAATPATTMSGTTLTQAELDGIAEVAISLWTDALGAGDARLASLADARFEVAQLAGDALGLAEGDTVLVDSDAAGRGWFVDVSPASSSEFRVRLDRNIFAATRESEAYGAMDLVTVLEHEIGHLLGFDHGDADAIAVMRATLDPGVRYVLDAPAPQPAASAPSAPAFDTYAGDGGIGAFAPIEWQAGGTGGWEVKLSPYDAGKPARGGASNIAPFELDLLGAQSGHKAGADFDSMGRALLGGEAKN